MFFEVKGRLSVGRLWAGIDMGKAHHHCVVIDTEGRQVLSRRVENDETVLLELIEEVSGMAEHDVVWAVDLVDGGAVSPTTLLLDRVQVVLYLPGRVVHRASGMYRGEGKTDARDAAVIADQARMRRDLRPLVPADPIAADLTVLTAHRLDVAADRIRSINRLREHPLSYFPALERAFDFSGSKGALKLLCGFRTPARIRESGESKLVSLLKVQKVHFAAKVGAAAVADADQQQAVLLGEAMASEMARRLARTILRLDDDIAELDLMIGTVRRAPRRADSDQYVRDRAGARRRTHRGHRRRHPRVRHSRPTGRRRWTCAGAAGLRPGQRQPAATAALLPTIVANLLPLRADQHSARSSIAGLLPA